jgi:hypothetical protein
MLLMAPGELALNVLASQPAQPGTPWLIIYEFDDCLGVVVYVVGPDVHCGVAG